jgi:hypothetical protein
MTDAHGITDTSGRMLRPRAAAYLAANPDGLVQGVRHEGPIHRDGLAVNLVCPPAITASALRGIKDSTHIQGIARDFQNAIVLLAAASDCAINGKAL